MSLNVVLVSVPESNRLVAQIWAGGDLVGEICQDGHSGGNGIILDVHLPDAAKPRTFNRDELTMAIREAAAQLKAAAKAAAAKAV